MTLEKAPSLPWGGVAKAPFSKVQRVILPQEASTAKAAVVASLGWMGEPVWEGRL